MSTTYMHPCIHTYIYIYIYIYKKLPALRAGRMYLKRTVSNYPQKGMMHHTVGKRACMPAADRFIEYPEQYSQQIRKCTERNARTETKAINTKQNQNEPNISAFACCHADRIATGGDNRCCTRTGRAELCTVSARSAPRS